MNLYTYEERINDFGYVEYIVVSQIDGQMAECWCEDDAIKCAAALNNTFQAQIWKAKESFKSLFRSICDSFKFI